MEKLNVIVMWIPFPTAVNILAMMVTFFAVMMKQPAHLLMMGNKQFGIRPRHIVNQCAITPKNQRGVRMTAMVMRLDQFVNFHVIVKDRDSMANQVLFARKINLEKLIGLVKEPLVFVSLTRSASGSSLEIRINQLFSSMSPTSYSHAPNDSELHTRKRHRFIL